MKYLQGQIINIIYRCFILMVTILSFTQLGYCQQDYLIDSLEGSLEAAKNGELKVDILNELAFNYYFLDFQKARNYAEMACQISDKIDYPRGSANCHVRLGTTSMLNQDFIDAKDYFEVALKLRKDLGDISDLASIYNLLGLLEYYQGKDVEAIEYYLDGLRISENITNLNITADLSNNISNSYRNLGEYKLAIEYIDKGIAIKSELGDETGIADLLMTLGNWYSELDNYEVAINKFKLALTIFEKFNIDKGVAKCWINIGNAKYSLGHHIESLQFLEKALKRKAILELNNIASINRTRGNIYRMLNQTSKAIIAFEESLRDFEALELSADIASLHYNIGLLNKDDLNFKESLKHFKKSQTILDTVNAPILEMKLFHEMSEVYTQLDEIELAFQYSTRHNSLQDSLDQSYREATNFKLNYEKELQKNELLEKELELVRLTNQKKAAKMRSYIILGFSLLVFTMLAFLFRNIKKKTKQRMLIKNQEIDKLLNDQELKTTYAKIEGQDEERKRIAQELHDRVGSILSTVKLYFDGFNSKLDSMQNDNIDQQSKANELLDEAVSEVRKIAQNIYSGTLTKFGLKAELDALSELLRDSKKINIEITTYGLEDRLPIALEIKIYRIIQELISNVLKHAKATEITIQLNQFNNVINFIVQDNGVGFELKETEEKNGMGLKSIRSRVYDLHGNIIIDSGKGNGTTVTIDIPREK